MLADFVPVKGVYPAGRLDRDSEGLVVLTDDGKLQARIADPRHKMEKTYLAQVEGVVVGRGVGRLARGCGAERWPHPARQGAQSVAEPDWLWPRRAADPGAQVGAGRLDRADPARRPQPAGAADVRGGGPALPAADPLAGGGLDAGRAGAGRMEAGMSAEEIIAKAGAAAAPRGRLVPADLGRARGGRAGRAGRRSCFCLQAGERSHWHRVDADEIWLWHAGAPLMLSMGVAASAVDRLLGPNVLLRDEDGRRRWCQQAGGRRRSRVLRVR